MKTVVVSSAQIGKYNRMDPTFHIAVQSVAAEVATLEAQGNKAELIARLAAVSTADLGPVLAPLTTGSRAGGYSRKELDVAIERYPYVAYALMLKAREAICQAAHARIAREQAYLADLSGIIPVQEPTTPLGPNESEHFKL